jgi:hypothetical protein
MYNANEIDAWLCDLEGKRLLSGLKREKTKRVVAQIFNPGSPSDLSALKESGTAIESLQMIRECWVEISIAAANRSGAKSALLDLDELKSVLLKRRDQIWKTKTFRDKYDYLIGFWFGKIENSTSSEGIYQLLVELDNNIRDRCTTIVYGEIKELD